MDGIEDGPVEVGEGHSHVPSVQTEHSGCSLLELRVVCKRVLRRGKEKEFVSNFFIDITTLDRMLEMPGFLNKLSS